jgi:hypothetical protein
MIKIQTIKDVYPAIDELISILANKSGEQRELSTILKNRMYDSSWTTGSELYEELKNVLQNFIKQKNHGLEDILIQQMIKVIDVISNWEKNRNIRWVKPSSKDWGKTTL